MKSCFIVLLLGNSQTLVHLVILAMVTVAMVTVPSLLVTVAVGAVTRLSVLSGVKVKLHFLKIGLIKCHI